MLNIKNIIEPVDYLVIGHLTQDITPKGLRLGGTAAYAALTAKALGARVGIVTSVGPEANLEELAGVQIVNLPCEQSSTFENIASPTGRIQYLYHVAPRLDFSLVPQIWRQAPIVHLGPIAQEVDPGLVRMFPDSILGLTPQGWLRGWDKDQRVHLTEWPEAAFVLEHASAAVLSIEDVQNNEDRIDEMAASIRILVVTEGARGCRVFWNGDLRHFSAPSEVEVDATGAGDIFAAAFFIRLHSSRNPWEAARFANHLAAASVNRPGLLSIPTPEEINSYTIEVIAP
jgi:Sugar kinases, ribokinase family